MSTIYYYQVWVRSIQYRGSEALTYSFSRKLPVGAIVTVPLRKELVVGVVVKDTRAPTFATKPIAAAFDLTPLPVATLQLALWVQRYYPAAVGTVTTLLVPSNLPAKVRNLPIPTAAPQPSAGFLQTPLTTEQQSALAAMRNADTYLLHGRTGSGKTRIYIELTKQALERGQSVMILSPEIGLTSQLAPIFVAAFGQRVAILHSRLTPKERRASWLTILTAVTPIVVVGPRSILFSPLKNVGLIVIDEAHDQAYKQEQSPHYQAVRVASQLSHIHNAMLVLGSATPAVTDYYLALAKNKTIVRLEHSAKPQIFSNEIEIVDLKDRSLFPRTPHLSLPLIKKISTSLAHNEQALLYLNRRGTARVALCENCGWQALCPNCDVSLTYHGDTHILRCHICGYRQTTLLNCPACGHPSIALRSFGTKAIVDEASKVFPEARIMRFDTDNLKTERLEDQYQHIVDGDVDILVGTQMIAKGLDLPRLSTLGVIVADSSLYMPDYTAQERTYQLLSQVIGRIGRGHIKGAAVIQTYQPDSPLLEAALHDDWTGFYGQEIGERRKYFFPPFSHLLKLTASRASSGSAEKAASALRKAIGMDIPSVEIEGPAPAFHEKAGGSYSWQLIVKARHRGVLLDIIAHLPRSGWTYDIDPNNLL